MSGTVDISAWRNLVKDELPNASNSIVDAKVLEACRGFCQRASAWVVRLDPQHVLANRPEYELLIPRETRLHAVIELKFLGRPLTKRALPDLESNAPNWEAKVGPPQEFTMLDSQVVRLIGIPQERVEKALTGTVAVLPVRNATTVGADLFEDWAEAIADGAKALLYSMKNTPWYDRIRHAEKEAAFTAHVDKARSRAAQGHLGGAVRRTRPHFF